MTSFKGLGMNLGNLACLSKAQTRSISPENFTGEKGKGGAATQGMVELEALGLKTTIIAKDIGYELRCHPPISYDREYTRYLGYSAVKFLVSGGTGAMIMLKDGKSLPIKFSDLLDPKTGKTRIRIVDIKADDYLMARRYMIRLEKSDLEGEALKKLAATAKLSPDDFKKKFSSAVE